MVLDKKKLLIAIGLIGFLSILLLTGAKDTFWNAVALGGLMIYFWVFEVIPIYITALFPLILAIPLGVLDKSQLANAYGDSNVYLFFGGFILALGLEKWNVHEQVARGIIGFVGDSKPRILFGFLMSTGLLSMWISNTATALMMMPMAMAIIHALPEKDRKSKFAMFLLLSVAYAASIGGVGTLIGSPPNTQMASILENTFHVKVDFFQWMTIGMPISILMLLGTFLFFYLSMGKERKESHAEFQLHKAPWTKDQLVVVGIFLMVVLLWSFKDLLVPYIGFEYGDENVALFGGVLMFLLPSTDTKKPLLNWKDTERLPWGILILFGGGLALAKIMGENGVIEKLSETFSSMHDYSFYTILITVIVVAVFASEVLSNLAMVSIFVPLVAGFAIKHGVSIEQLAIPLTLGASLAFMLPVGTPPNAIVFSSGMLDVKQMVKYGFVLNVIGIALIFLCSILIL
jgi:solute carrier family 13 (sodium-dependent dicarboxylate transporter), member 2/3/5